MFPKLRSVGLVCAMVAICLGLAAFAAASPLRADATIDAGRMSSDLDGLVIPQLLNTGRPSLTVDYEQQSIDWLLAVSLHDWRERLRDRLRHPLPALRGGRGRCTTCDARHRAFWSAPIPA